MSSLTKFLEAKFNNKLLQQIFIEILGKVQSFSGNFLFTEEER